MMASDQSDVSTSELASKLARELKGIPERYGRYPYAIKGVAEKLAKVLGQPHFAIEKRLAGTKEEAALKLRELVRPELDTNPPNYRLARWIVSDWGRIDRAKQRLEANEASFNERIRVAEDWSKSFLRGESNGIDIKRVASWSKYLAFRDPEHFAIYDARVAYSLNWLLFKCGQKRDFFPFLTGANTLMMALDYRLGLARRVIGESIHADLSEEVDYICSVDDGRARKSHFMSKLEERLCLASEIAYGRYCRLIKEVGHRIHRNNCWGLTRVEMALFAAAPFVAKQVFDEFYSVQSK